MATNAPLVMRIVSASVKVANRASQIVRDVLAKGDLGIVEKGKMDLQTEADRSAQRCIVASLHKQFPNVTIYGEENLDPSEKIPPNFLEVGHSEEVLSKDCPQYLKDAKDEDIVIWVDPLDGTAEFTQGLLDHVTVLIGIAVQGHAVAGIINQPYFNYKEKDLPVGRTIWGICGLGAYGFVRNELPKDKRIITTSRSHSNRMVTETIDACEPDEVVRVGGAGHKVLLLIEGKVHAYVFATKGCKKWDTCAPEAILHAVGGTLTDMFGIRMSYSAGVQRLNAGGVLATTSDHQFYIDRIPEDIKNNLEKSAAAPLGPPGVFLGGVNDQPTSKPSPNSSNPQGDSETMKKISEEGSSVDPKIYEQTKL